MARKYVECRVCYKDLADGYTDMGFCPRCVRDEVKRVKKYYRDALIRGPILFAIVFIGIYAVKMMYAGGSVAYTGPNPFLLIFTEWLNGIASLSIGTQVIIGLMCFLIPAGHYIELDYGSTRASGGDGLVSLAILLLEVFASVVTAPVKLIRNAVRLKRLRELMAKSPPRA